jgi:hypothetical protein
LFSAGTGIHDAKVCDESKKLDFAARMHKRTLAKRVKIT